MTLVLDRPLVDESVPESDLQPRSPRRRRSRRRLPGWLCRRPDLLWLAPILAVGTFVNAWGLMRAPQRVDDEGTYMAQAYAVQKFGELAHYTYWYDHPPLGWLQIAALTSITDAFGWPVSAVAAGRVLMLAFNVVSAVLLWSFARRLDLSRPAAAVAVLLFSLSPLAVSFHRMVYLDNIAVMWTLAAFTLAASRHHQMGSFVGSAACFTMAVLTKETFVLLLPALAWLMWQRSVPATRRYTLAITASTFVLLCSGYLAFAALKSELTPGPQRVSLWQGVVYQLVSRPGSGPVWQRDSASSQTLHIWMGLDAALLVAGLICAVAMLAVRTLRPIALGFLLLSAMLLRSGYLPIPYVIAVIPLAAVLISATAEHGLRRRLLRPVVAIAAAAAVFVAAPAWGEDLNGLTHDDMDRPMRQAQSWIVHHVHHNQRVLVDDAVWVDLKQAGFPRDNDVWFFKADTDPAVKRKAPHGWRDYDYLMVTSSVRATLDIGMRGGQTPYPRVQKAYQHSVPAASFGSGYSRVWVRRIRDRRSAGAPKLTGQAPAAPNAPTWPQASTGSSVAPPRPAPAPASGTPSRRTSADGSSSTPSARPTTDPSPRHTASSSPAPKHPKLRLRLGRPRERPTASPSSSGEPTAGPAEEPTAAPSDGAEESR